VSVCSRSRPVFDDAGAGTVLAVGLAGVVVLVGLVLGALGAATMGRTAAQSAADLAALAAADVLALEAVLGADPHGGAGRACERARSVAARNGTVVEECSVEGSGVVVVRVVREQAVGAARAAARAGPAR